MKFVIQELVGKKELTLFSGFFVFDLLEYFKKTC